MLEREARLDVSTGLVASALVGRLADGEVCEGETRLLTSVYYDTPDLRLLRSGITLRFRDDDGWMVKLLQPSDRPPLEQRMEVGVRGSVPSVPIGALDLVRAAARTTTFEPLLRTETMRRFFTVTRADGSSVARIEFDRVSADAGHRGSTAFKEVEIKLAASEAFSALGPIVARLRALGAGDLVRLPKVARGLGLDEIPAPEVAVPVLVGNPTAGEVVRVALARSVRRYLEHAPAVVLDEDSEGVHQARVATRRLRSDLRTFRRFLNREWTDRLRAEVRLLTDLLGTVRDLDVLEIRLEDLMGWLPEPEHESGRSVLQTLRVEREAKLQRAIESMREEWYLPLLDRMVAAAAAPELTGRSDRLADPTIVRLARKPWQRLREAVQRLPTEPSSEELHRVRILTKRARYAVEAVAVIGGPAADHFAFRLAELQGVLGEHQDAIVAAAWLRRRVPAQARAAGELIGFEVARSNRAAEGWRESWASVERRPLIRWMD